MYIIAELLKKYEEKYNKGLLAISFYSDGCGMIYPAGEYYTCIFEFNSFDELLTELHS